MKIGTNKLRMSSGAIRTFKSQGARDRFEKFARAYKHGWRPTNKARVSAVHRRKIKKMFKGR